MYSKTYPDFGLRLTFGNNLHIASIKQFHKELVNWEIKDRLLGHFYSAYYSTVGRLCDYDYRAPAAVYNINCVHVTTLSLLCGVVLQNAYCFVYVIACVCEYFLFVFITWCDFMYACFNL